MREKRGRGGGGGLGFLKRRTMTHNSNKSQKRPIRMAKEGYSYDKGPIMYTLREVEEMHYDWDI